VTKRALDSFYQAPGQGCNLALQLNSVALLPKEERQILKLYQAVPRRAKNRSKQIRPPHQKRLRVVAEEESIVKDMV
jgi:phage-related protein